MQRSFLLTRAGMVGLAALLASCCEPAHKDSQPYVVNSMFEESYGRDIALLNQGPSSIPDSAYYPIYTFAIQNTGTQDDDYTLQLRYRYNPNFFGSYESGFDITKHVLAGQVALFKTPIPVPDSITRNEQISYNVGFNAGDSVPSLDEIYNGLSFQTRDSAEIHSVRPTIDIVYGAIDNGPEGCNTPASTLTMTIDSLPVR